MQHKREEDFAKALKGQRPRGLFLLYGRESYLIESWTKKLAASFDGAFNLQKLDGRKPDWDALYDAVETLPLMAQEKCVILDDVDLKGIAPGKLDQLQEILSDLAPFCTLIITGKPGTFDPKSAAGKKLIQWCGDKGHAVQLDPRGGAGLARFLCDAAKKEGCQLTADLARYLVQLCGDDMGLLRCEIAKICALAGEGTITRQHVDRVAVPQTEARVFDLSKAILAGNPQRALEILDDLFYLREQPVGILAVLSMAYVDLYRARVARDSGKTTGQVVADFGYKGREFRVNNAWNSRLSKETLRASLEALMEGDRRMKSTGVDGKILLEQTVVQLLAIQGGN